MSRSFLASLVLLLASPLLLAAEGSADAPGILLDRVVAIVNDGIVTQSELDEAMNTAVRRLREARRNNAEMPPLEDIRRQVMDQLVLNRIQSQRAERIGIKIDDEAVNRELQALAEENGLTLAQLPAVLERDGYNYAAFREERRQDMARQQLRRREVLQRVSITPRELDQFMERMKKLPDERAEYNISHILISLPPEANQEQVNELAKRAEEVSRRAATEDFAQLAVTYSNAQTALEGGQMGWRSGAELPTLLAETIARLKAGEVSKPIVASNGDFHIVKLNAVRTADGDPVQEQTHARHILLTTNALQDDATVRQRLSDIRRRVLAGEDFAVFAASLSTDEASAVDGGDLGWLNMGDTVALFQAEMDKLKDGEISEPFKTEFGWHIVQVLGRRTVDVTEDMLRNRAIGQLRQSKADDQLEGWLRELREESFIEIIE
ncbi:MAG TPA: peptidylprolyl isomerase [Steroidobacteraceae bacterium]|nr:peptidylprolyl isomerase [Steroidobacteraceae bacterium]